MANKNKSKKTFEITIQDPVEYVTEQVTKVQDTALNLANKAVDGSLKVGAKWQHLFAKSLKFGTDVFGKQQNMTLNFLEELKRQINEGNIRVKQLLDLGKEQPKTPVSLDDLIESAMASTKETVDTAVAPKKKAKAAVTPKAKKAPAKKKAPVAKKPTVTQKAPAVKKAPVAKKAPAVKATTDKLTVINGIGPKIQTLLQEGGIKTYADLANATEKSLKTILEAAGPIFKTKDVSSWNEQAKLAAAGKMEELKTFQTKAK